ncbi:protein roadkill-like [Mercenaria mercenaria]|uniref:protein roadkill-like n=1 Tax=Mercenaria mercenaria TaxID=6596 RepID=UPI001E1D86F9|nr:protein roadkill-like [Mercenaria mercenaria]
MSTKTTPRVGTQATMRSQTRSVIPPHSELKTKTSVGGSTERIATASTFERLSSIGDTTTRSEVGQEMTSKTETTDLPFFKQDQFTDVVLQVGGKKLYTCRALLAFNSPVMAKILSSGSTKNKDLDLPEKEYEDVVELLAFIDPRVDYLITEQSAIALLPLAEEYEIRSLKELCEQTIIQSFRRMKKGKKPGSIPVDISLEYLHMADKYEFPGLRKLVTDEFVNNEDPNATKSLMESTLISEHMKLTVLDKKVEKVHFELDRERRERTAIETKLGDYGHKRIGRRPLLE